MSNSLCAVCGKRHRFKGSCDEKRDIISCLCLDCHGNLIVIGKLIYACEKCLVKHGCSFGVFHRSNVLMNRIDGKVYDFRDRSILSVFVGGSIARPSSLRD
jgi:hypothetical protein